MLFIYHYIHLGRIVSRRLRVGLTNGRCFLRAPTVMSLSYRNMAERGFAEEGSGDESGVSNVLETNVNLDLKVIGYVCDLMERTIRI